MAFRGHIALNNTELANSLRTLTHLGRVAPTSDIGVLVGVPTVSLLIESPPGSGLYLPNNETPELFPGLYSPGPLEESSEEGLYFVVPGGADQCRPVTAAGYDEDELLFEIPSSSEEVAPGLWSPPDGARRYDTGMFIVGDLCWQEAGHCRGCDSQVSYDDSWPGLKEFLGDTIYRPELAPWHSTRQPESAEFFGVWITALEGLGPVQVQRQVTEMIGSGGSAGPHRDASRVIKVEATLLACTNAGLEFGLNWLACRLRETNDNDDSVLRFFAAHPSYTSAVPDDLVREVHGVVLTQSPSVTGSWAPSGKQHQQATIYAIEWQMTVTSPYVYRPPFNLPVYWDDEQSQLINWTHAPECKKPDNCDDMPVLWSATCVPEEIEVIVDPVPSCGGCMPVAEIMIRTFRAPLADFAQACRETAVNFTIINLGGRELTLQAYWRVCGSDIRCEDNRWPIQINGLPEGSTLTIDSVNNRQWAEFAGKLYRPKHILSTPTGAPWQPVVLDRTQCWELVVQAPAYAQFDIHLQLVDREP